MKLQTIYVRMTPPTDRWSRLRNRLAPLIAAPGKRVALIQLARGAADSLYDSSPHFIDIYVRLDVVGCYIDQPILLKPGQSITNEVT